MTHDSIVLAVAYISSSVTSSSIIENTTVLITANGKVSVAVLAAVATKKTTSALSRITYDTLLLMYLVVSKRLSPTRYK